MKLLSDFDGVWTNPNAEGVAQGEYVDRTLASWTSDPAHAAEWIRSARLATRREPTRWGWLSNGRMSAFADEDPFIQHSALLHYVHDHSGRDAVAGAMRDGALAQGFADFDVFGGHSHAHAVEQVVQQRGPGILPEAAAAGRQLLAHGIEVVVVSNSTPDKLLHWFEHANVPRTLHPEQRDGALRVRGSARKFVLGPTARGTFDLGGTAFEIDRPSYEAILVDERPDAIVGDVFSLDLALPLAFRRREPGWTHVRLFWLVHPYTPAWLMDVVRRHAPEVEPIEGGLKGLATRLVDPLASPGGGVPQPRVS